MKSHAFRRVQCSTFTCHLQTEFCRVLQSSFTLQVKFICFKKVIFSLFISSKYWGLSFMDTSTLKKSGQRQRPVMKLLWESFWTHMFWSHTSFFFWIYKIVENFSFSDLLGGTRVCNDTCWGGRVALRSVEAAKIFFYFFTLPFIMYKCFVIDIDIFFKYEFWRVLFWFSIHSAWFSRTWKNSAQAKTLPPGLLGHRWDSREEGIAEPACQKIFSRQIRGGRGRGWGSYHMVEVKL